MRPPRRIATQCDGRSLLARCVRWVELELRVEDPLALRVMGGLEETGRDELAQFVLGSRRHEQKVLFLEREFETITSRRGYDSCLSPLSPPVDDARPYALGRG